MSEKLLKMIEAVDPSDTAKLDEIDGRVECYFQRNLRFVSLDYRGYGYFPITTAAQIEESIEHPAGYEHRFEAPKYTRSRDALKSIRPEGWAFSTSYFKQSGGFKLNATGGYDRYVQARKMPSEELAELHVIIQAIAYKRNLTPQAT